MTSVTSEWMCRTCDVWSRLVLVALCCFVVTMHALPQQHLQQPAPLLDSQNVAETSPVRARRSTDADAFNRKTWQLIRDLEEAVFRLKEHMLDDDVNRPLHRTRTSSVSNTAADVNESYPELTSELQEKNVHEGPSSSSTSSSSSKKSSAGTNPSRPASGSQSDDMSLKEALQFLVNLAKEKKQEERRDYDIPFP